MPSTRLAPLLATGLATALLAAAPAGASAAAGAGSPLAETSARGRRRAGARGRARGRVRRRAAFSAARFRLSVSGSASVDWTYRRDGVDGCYRIAWEYAGSERWSVRSRQPTTVTIFRDDDPRFGVRLRYDEDEREAPGRPGGSAVAGSWTREARGLWEQHPESTDPSCRGAVHVSRPVERAGCGTRLPEQRAELMLGFGEARMAFSKAANLPPGRPFDRCEHWPPVGLGTMPVFAGDVAVARLPAAQVMAARVGRTLTMRGRQAYPAATTMPGVVTRGTFAWEARLTRVSEPVPGD